MKTMANLLGLTVLALAIPLMATSNAKDKRPTTPPHLCKCGGDCQCDPIAEATKQPTRPNTLADWSIDIQHSGQLAAVADQCNTEATHSDGGQFVWAQLPIPQVEYDANPDRSCPDGQCPNYANSVPIGQMQRSAANCPNGQCPTVPRLSPSVSVPHTVLDIDGDGRASTRNDYLLHLREHGIDGAAMSMADMKAAHLRVHGSNPNDFCGWSAPTIPWNAMRSSSCPNCPTRSNQAAASYIAGQVNRGGQFRPFGSARDGQGWWLGKRLGRAMPARRARRRGY